MHSSSEENISLTVNSSRSEQSKQMRLLARDGRLQTKLVPKTCPVIFSFHPVGLSFDVLRFYISRLQILVCPLHVGFQVSFLGERLRADRTRMRSYALVFQLVNF